MRIKRVQIITTILMVMMCGCSANNKAQSQTTNIPSSLENQNELPLIYEKVTDSNVTFDMSITVDKEVDINQLKETYAERQIIDYDKALELLFEGEAIKEQYIDSIEDEEGNKVEAPYYQSEDGTVLSLSIKGSFFAKPLFYHIYNSFRLYEDEEYNADKFSTDKDLPFESREESFAKIKELLSQLGLEIDTQYKCYTLDYQTLEQEEVAINNDGEIDEAVLKESWTQEDDCYYFVVKQIYNNIPIFTPLAGIFTEINDDTAPLKILYSKNGIEMLEINELFKFGDSSQKLELKSMDEIAETIEKKYGMIITDNQYIVQKAELYYRPLNLKQGQFELTPVWAVDIEEIQPVDNESNESNVLHIFVNAVTAEEIL